MQQATGCWYWLHIEFGSIGLKRFEGSESNMETNLLRAFITVAELGSLTKAANLLHLSQPAVSGQLKTLEEYLTLRLFERSSAGMRLTKAGQALLPKAQSVLAANDDLRNVAKGLEGSLTGRAKVGTILDPALIKLGEFMSSILEHYPWLDIELHHGISPWAMEEVSNGSLDAAFFMGSSIHTNVKVIPLTDVNYRIVAPFALKEEVMKADWREMAALPWIIANKQSPHLQMVSSMFNQMGLTPLKVIQADQESTINYLIAEGVGVSLMREDLALAAQNSGRGFIWDKARPTTKLSFISASGREGDAIMTAIETVIRRIWHGAENSA
jgi:DNA-binding transcriptional LysR family regulator